MQRVQEHNLEHLVRKHKLSEQEARGHSGSGNKGPMLAAHLGIAGDGCPFHLWTKCCIMTSSDRGERWDAGMFDTR
jgi:hypothetical protein